MSDDDISDGNGRVNWACGIAVSLCLHALLLGALWFFCAPEVEPIVSESERPADSMSGGSSQAQEARPQGDAPANTGANGGAATMTDVSRESATPTAPQTQRYVVKKGDSLSRIANRCGCTLSELAKMNNLPISTMLSIGQILQVPIKAQEQ